jgi:hypothetical protein
MRILKILLNIAIITCDIAIIVLILKKRKKN